MDVNKFILLNFKLDKYILNHLKFILGKITVSLIFKINMECQAFFILKVNQACQLIIAIFSIKT